jgi:hypothetical protein
MKKKAVGVIMKINVERRRGRIKPKPRWLDIQYENYMKAVSVCLGDEENRD